MMQKAPLAVAALLLLGGCATQDPRNQLLIAETNGGPGTLGGPPTVTLGDAPPGAPPRPADPCPPGRDWVYSDLGRWYCQ